MNGHVAEVVSTDRSPYSEPVYSAWKHWEPTLISHHGSACCEIAREWVGSFDQSVLNGASPLTGPRWLGN
ncbi:MAG: hypothetical protein ABIR33_02995, partial [Pyrinomonadaceae bacterium]